MKEKNLVYTEPVTEKSLRELWNEIIDEVNKKQLEKHDLDNQ